MAGEGGGGVVLPGAGVYEVLDAATGGWWGDTFGLHGEERRRPDWKRKSFLREHGLLAPGQQLRDLPRVEREAIWQRAYQLMQQLDLSGARGPKKQRRLIERLERRERSGRLSASDVAAMEVLRATRQQATQPGGPDPTGPPVFDPTVTGPEPAWLRLLRIAADQWQLYREQQEARELERAQRRAFRMSLSDTIGNVLGGIAEATPTILPAILGARAQERASRDALRMARAGFAPGAYGTVGALGGALGALLGEEPGVLEEGGMLEGLGLEGDIERTATLWRRTAGGFTPVRTITARHPTSGSLSTWVNMGRPVLYTGDLAACKRVNRIAARTARVARRRGVVRSPFRRRRR